MKTFRVHTDFGTSVFSLAEAREFVEDYRNSEDRVRREVAMELEELIEENELR